MDGGLVVWNNIVQSLVSDKISEDKIIDMINLYVKGDVNNNIRIYSILACAAQNKKFKCAKAVFDSGLIEHTAHELKYVFRYWENYKHILYVLFRFGVKLPAESVVRGWIADISKTEKSKAMKKLEFVAKLKSGGNNARKAALTMLAIIRFRRNEHMSYCINMDVMRMIARMIYESGLTDWKVWKTGRRKSNRLHTNKRIKK